MKGISIIIPTYNREQFIEEAIQSVLDQEYEGRLEIIVSDDGSSDRTLEIAESFNNRVTVLRKPANCLTQGASSTRNRGIRASSEPYICFLDSDDFFLPGHLKKISLALESEQNLGFAFCRTLEIKEEKDTRLFKAWTRVHITKNDILYPVISKNNIVCTNVFIFQKYVFDKVGVFNETYMNGEDGDMWMRISEQYKGTFVDYFGAVRRKHEFNQISDTRNRAVLKCHSEIYKNACKRYYQSGIKDFYRIFRLRILVFKYRIYYFTLFFYIYRYYINYKNTQNTKSNDWHVLSHFL
ncbi:MAG TPA: glycosyltransferase family A protein [Candidatus Paceibacterota bacterium]